MYSRDVQEPALYHRYAQAAYVSGDVQELQGQFNTNLLRTSIELSAAVRT